MSNIPAAREKLQMALDCYPTEGGYREAIQFALANLDRKKPKFIAERTRSATLSPFNKRYARDLRATGMSLRVIALTLKSDIGRVSEACA